MFSIKDSDVALVDIKNTNVTYMAVKDLLFYPSGNLPRLPHEYQEVEYIESTGTQYISTNYTPIQNTEFEIEYEIVSYNQRYSVPMGTRYDHNVQAYYFGYENNDNSYYGFGNNKADPSSVDFHGVGVRRSITYHNNVLSNGTQSVTVSVNQQPAGTIRIFGEEQQGNVQELGCMKLYKFKLREGEILIRDFVPCYRVSDGAIGLYDLVEGKFYTNSGTGTFFKGAPVNAWQMPSGYTELQYIQNTGTQYIDTGLLIKDGYRFFAMVNSVNQQTGDGGRITGGYLGQVGSIYYRLYFGGIGGSAGTSGWSYGYLGDFNNGTTGSASLGTAYEVDFSWISGNAFLKVNGNTLKSWTGTYSTTLGGKVCIMASHDTNTQYNIHPGLKVYYARYYNGQGELVRDFVPCIRDSDGVIGLYDLVTEQFFANSGTGDFVAGPIVMRDGFKPTENTIVYYQFDGNLDDSSGNSRNLSMTTGSFSYSTLASGGKYVQTNTSAYSSTLNIPFGRTATVSFFLSYTPNTHGYNGGTILELINQSYSSGNLVRPVYYRTGSSSTALRLLNNDNIGYNPSVAESRHYYCFTLDENHTKLYVDGQLVAEGGAIVDSNLTSMVLRINSVEGNNRQNYAGNCKLGELIIESKTRASQEQQSYFNKMKKLYGIS